MAVWITYGGGECWFKGGSTLTPKAAEGVVACWPQGHNPPQPPPPPPPPPPPLYSVEIVSVGSQPVLSALNQPGHGYSPYGFTYNPSWVEASAGTSGIAGVFVRLQNCTNRHTHCYGEGITGFAPCDLEAGTCGDLWTNFSLPGSDPRVVYHQGVYYNFHEESGGVGLSTSRTPLDNRSWTAYGRILPSRNGCMLPRAAAPHYLLNGDTKNIALYESHDLTNWTLLNDSSVVPLFDPHLSTATAMLMAFASIRYRLQEAD